MRYFVRRSIDGAILAKNGGWYKTFGDVGDVKLYKTLRNAQKYGSGRIPDRMYRQELGNLQSIGTVVTVRDGQTVDVCGNVFPE
jgi:hypothetical protein